MTGLSEEGGLRDEIGSSSINSPRRHTSRSSPFVEGFGDKENRDAESRATSVAVATSASASSPDGSPRGSPSAPGGKLGCGPSTESLFGPPKIRQLKTPDTTDVRPRGFSGGTAIGEHGRSSADYKAGWIEHPQELSSPRTGPTIVKSTWSAGDGGAGGGGSGGSSVLRGAQWLRAKRRVVLSAARARGVPVHTPKMLFVPSKLMHNTPASRAAAFTPPTPVRPRFVPRRCYFGKAVAASAPKDAEKHSAAAESRRKGLVSRTTSSSAGAGKKRELLRERRGLVLSAEFDDEVSAAPASVKETSFTTIASAARSTDPELTIPRHHSRPRAWAGSTLALPPLAVCEERCSGELEEEARRRSDAGWGACPWMQSEGTSKARLEISLEAVERDDDVLMSPCASVGLLSALEEEASVGGAPGDAVPSSTDSPWSMVSPVAETKREPNAREDRLSGGDPVARMLLKQSDDLVESDGGGGCTLGPPHAMAGLEKRITVPLISPRPGRPSIFGMGGKSACFGIASVERNTAVGLDGGRSAETGERGRASTIPFSVDLGGGSERTATFWGRRGSGVGAPGATSFGESFGGVCDSDRGRLGSLVVESEGDRHFRPITSPRL